MPLDALAFNLARVCVFPQSVSKGAINEALNEDASLAGWSNGAQRGAMPLAACVRCLER